MNAILQIAHRGTQLVSCGKSIYRTAQSSGSGSASARSILEALAAYVVPASLLTFSAGAFSGKQASTPSGDGYYGPNAVVRDWTMQVRGCPTLFTATQISDFCEMIASIAGADGVNEGLNGNGSEIAWGGGGGSDRSTIPIDNQFEFVDMVYSHFLKTGSASKYTALESTILSAYNATTHHTIQNHLVYISPSTFTGHVVEWGFWDSWDVRGYASMTSVMRFRATRQIAEMLTALGRTSDAAAHTAEATAIQAALETYCVDSGSGMLKFGTEGANQQKSPIASAYAAAIGAVGSTRAGTISDALYNRLDGQSLASDGCFLNGQVRDTCFSDPALDGEGAGTGGSYQAGGYWAIATGWVAKAISINHVAAADAFMQVWATETIRQGSAAPYEYATSGGGSGSHQYGASAALPLQYFLSNFNR